MLDVKGKYSKVMLMGGDLIGVTGLFKYDDLNDKIVGVKIIKVSSNGSSFYSSCSSSLVGAVVAGVGGAITMALMNRKSIELDCDIYFKDGTTMQLCTDRKDIIKFLMNYMEVKGGKRW